MEEVLGRYLHRFVISGFWMVLFFVELAFTKGPPQVVSKIQTHHVMRAGDTLRLSCPVQSDPSPIIAWQKDGESIHPGWERFRISDASVLRIKDLEPIDSGVIVCRATNGFGTVSVKYLLFVYDANFTSPPPADFDEDIFESLPGREDPPQFTSLDEMDPVITQPAGTTIRLTCKSSGKPKPEVTWYKNGVVLHAREVNNDASEGWMLKIVEVRETDSGRYLCKVTNTAGSINYTYEIRVTDTLSLDEDNAGLITGQPKNTTALLGSTAQFHCEIQSDAVPRVQWLKRLEFSEANHRRTTTNNNNKDNNNNTVTLNGQQFAVLHGDVMTSRDDGTFLNKLTINSVSAGHAGMYICSAKTNQGFSYRSAFLSVLPSGANGSGQRLDTGSLFDAAFLPAIIAIIVVVGLIFLAVVAFVTCRRRVCGEKGDRASPLAAPPTDNPSQRLATPSAPVCANNTHPFQHPDPRCFDHPYAAGVRPNYPGVVAQNVIGAPSRELLARYHADPYADYSSISKHPVLQTSVPNKQLLMQQHHYQQQQQQQQQQQLQHSQLQFYENC